MKQIIRQPVFAVLLLALAAGGPLSAAAADEQKTMTQAAESPVQQQSQDDELIKSIDIWQLVEQDSPQETPLPAAETAESAAEPAQETVILETQPPLEKEDKMQQAASPSSAQQNNAVPLQSASQESIWDVAPDPAQEAVIIEAQAPAEEQPLEKAAASEPSQSQAVSPAAVSSGQQTVQELALPSYPAQENIKPRQADRIAGPAQEAVIIEAQAPAEEQPLEKAAASEPSQSQAASPAAVPGGQQNSGVPAQNAAQPPSWPDQEIVVIKAPAEVQPLEKTAASATGQPLTASPVAVLSGQQNSGAPAQSAAPQPVKQAAGWPVPELPQSLPSSALTMPSASVGQSVQQPGGMAVLAAPAAAKDEDDIVAAVEEAMRQYRNKDFAGAVSNLDYAAHLIRQKKTELLKALLPEPFYGWQAKEAVSQSLGTAVFGGGSTVSRDYFTQNGSAVSIEIVSDSPVLQSIIMMLNNPLFAGASGGNLKTIKRQRAMIKYNDEEHSGEINVVVANRFIVTVKGRGIDLTWLLRYAEAMDFEALARN